MTRAYGQIGLEFSESSEEAVRRWASRHEPGAHGRHTYELSDFGLEADQVRERFARYLATYDAGGVKT